ncbi:MAG: 5'/3'-nucleotidase SurE [Planctomycetota bacterium]
MTQRRTLLLTNDDGVCAPGLRALHEALRDNFDVVVAAPDTDMTGVAHAVTLLTPLRYEALPSHNGMDGFKIFGTAADCVKFAAAHLLSRKPDIVVSGMNPGENSGVSVFYSGTVAAAREGAFWQIPSFAFSISDGGWEHLKEYCRKAATLVQQILSMQSPELTRSKNCPYYNINFPACAPHRSRGVKVVRQSFATFADRYLQKKDPQGGEQFWLRGLKQAVESSMSFDTRALLEGYVAVTPLDLDTTSQDSVEALRGHEQLS